MNEALEQAERTVRAWHKAARIMCDLAIAGDCKSVERVYFNAALGLPFYGVDPEPLPSQKSSGVPGQSQIREE